MMTQSKIKLNATEEVQEFVNAATKCDFDIDIYYNRFLIDAKSILGILSMDLTKVLTVECHGQSYQIRKDQVFKFETDQDHIYRNEGGEKACCTCFFLDYHGKQ